MVLSERYYAQEGGFEMKQFLLTVIGVKDAKLQFLASYVRDKESDMFVYNSTFDVVDGKVDILFLDYVRTMLELGYQMVSDKKL